MITITVKIEDDGFGTSQDVELSESMISPPSIPIDRANAVRFSVQELAARAARSYQGGLRE